MVFFCRMLKSFQLNHYNMTDHQKFKALLESVGLTYKSLADELGLKYNSVKDQLAPGKQTLPKWAKSMLLLDKLKNNQ